MVYKETVAILRSNGSSQNVTFGPTLLQSRCHSSLLGRFYWHSNGLISSKTFHSQLSSCPLRCCILLLMVATHRLMLYNWNRMDKNNSLQIYSLLIYKHSLKRKEVHLQAIRSKIIKHGLFFCILLLLGLPSIITL